jgi:hypothetical protein
MQTDKSDEQFENAHEPIRYSTEQESNVTANKALQHEK